MARTNIKVTTRETSGSRPTWGNAWSEGPRAGSAFLGRAPGRFWGMRPQHALGTQGQGLASGGGLVASTRKEAAGQQDYEIPTIGYMRPPKSSAGSVRSSRPSSTSDASM